MADLFATGRIVDFILAVVLLEAAGMALYRSRTGAGVPLPGFLANLASGACLLLALRAALAGSAWHVTAAWLLAGLLAHLADMALRWRR